MANRPPFVRVCVNEPEHTLFFWKSQVESLHSGELEAIFDGCGRDLDAFAEQMVAEGLAMVVRTRTAGDLCPACQEPVEEIFFPDGVDDYGAALKAVVDNLERECERTREMRLVYPREPEPELATKAP